MSSTTARLAIAQARDAARAPGTRLSQPCVEVLSVSGAAVVVGAGRRSGPLSVSDPTIGAIEDLQFTLGEGPSLEVCATGSPVFVSHFERDTRHRWPSFHERALSHGVGAMFVFPMTSHGTTIGALSTYQREPGSLSRNQLEDGAVLAAVLCETVLSLQDDVDDEGDLAEGLAPVVTARAEVHQASGMVAVQLGIPVADGLVRLRARAFALGVDTATLARDVVLGRVRFDDVERRDGDGRP